jgi:dTMP kinase
MENAGREFYERVRKGYLAIAREQPGRFVVIDGMRNVNDIARDIRRAVEERLEQPQREEK